MRKARILMWDIEATHLKATFGHIICIGWKFYGEEKLYCASKTQSPNFKNDPIDDSWVLEQFAKAYEKADVQIFHYGRKFDFPYVNTRRMFHGLDPLFNKPSIDTWRVMKDELAFHSNKLEAAVEFFGLPKKTPLNGQIWQRAAYGDRKSVGYVVEHCKADIVSLEAVYHKLRPVMRSHPNINLVTGNLFACPVCGSTRIVRDGYKIQRAGTVQIYKCNNCGAKRPGKPQRPKITYEDFDYPR